MRTCFPFLLAAAALALAAGQKPAAAPPPEVEKALRERVAKFYQAHVDGKYRQAEQYIAEDSKDLYYASQKPHYLNYSIQRIEWAENFTVATVFTRCELELRHPIAGTMNFNVLSDSSWKLENGLWVWFIDPNLQRGAFGETRHVEPGSAKPPYAVSGTKPSGGIVAQHANPEKLLSAVAGAVKADKSEVRLEGPGSSAEVVLTNTLGGPVKLKLQVPVDAGFAARLESESAPAKGTVRLLIRPTGVFDQPPAALLVTVEATGQTIPVRVVFGPAKN